MDPEKVAILASGSDRSENPQQCGTRQVSLGPHPSGSFSFGTSAKLHAPAHRCLIGFVLEGEKLPNLTTSASSQECDQATDALQDYECSDRKSAEELLRGECEALKEQREKDKLEIESLTKQIEDKDRCIASLVVQRQRTSQDMDHMVKKSQEMGKKLEQIVETSEERQRQSEEQLKEAQKHLEEERDRSKSFKENAGILESENKKLNELVKKEKCETERALSALSDVDFWQLRQLRANAEKNIGDCDLAIAKLLNKQPLDRTQLSPWQTHKFSWETMVRDIQKIIVSQVQEYNSLIAGFPWQPPMKLEPVKSRTLTLLLKSPTPLMARNEKPRVQNVAKSTSPDKVTPPAPAVTSVLNFCASQIDLIFSALKNRFPDLTREMLVVEMLALGERSGGKLITVKSAVEQMEQVLAAKIPRTKRAPILLRGNECMICHEEIISKNLTECTACHHKYHNQCVNECLKKQKGCPMCRFAFPRQ